MVEVVSWNVLLGRDAELRRLKNAIRNRVSQLIWGSADAGKTFLVKKAIEGLNESERRTCVYCAGPATGRELLTHLAREVYLAGDPFMRKKVHTDGANEMSLNRWLQDQSVLRLRGLLYTATEKGEYRFFLDHFPPASQRMAHLMKEFVYRCKTPIFLTGQGCTQGDIGNAWSLFWTDECRIRLGPLSDAVARDLLEKCIRKFGLSSLDLEGFRQDVLQLSGRLPGSIVRMCELAADPRYHFGDQIKIRLVHVDYLMRTNPANYLHPVGFPR